MSTDAAACQVSQPWRGYARRHHMTRTDHVTQLYNSGDDGFVLHNPCDALNESTSNLCSRHDFSNDVNFEDCNFDVTVCEENAIRYDDLTIYLYIISLYC